MAPQGPKSWLLGAGYDWRTDETRPNVGVSYSAKDGLSLIEKSRGKEQPAQPPPPSPRFRFDRLSYDIDREHREVLAYTPDGKIRHRWASRDAEGVHVAPSDPAAWEPVDIAGDGDCVFLLDTRYQRVYTHAFGRESLSLLFQSEDETSRWVRILLDDHGCLLVFDQAKAEVRCYGRRGSFLGLKPTAWPAPAPEPPPPVKTPAAPDETTYEKQGYWFSKPLDSGIYNCCWHRIEMKLTKLPPGSKIEVKVFAHQDQNAGPLNARDPRWISSYVLAAPLQPPPEEDKEQHAGHSYGSRRSKHSKKKQEIRVDEFLIQSDPGQFLWVLVELSGDTFGSPIVKGLRVHYPRESYLEYLPPLYSADEPTRVFLDRFLSIFQTEWDEFERQVEESEAYFDPDAVPEGVAMTYLASWLGLNLEGEWDGEQNRRLLRAVPKIYPRRGTREALRDYVRVYLANVARMSVEGVPQTSYPAIVEGFEERQYFMLSQPGGSRLFSLLRTSIPNLCPGGVGAHR